VTGCERRAMTDDLNRLSFLALHLACVRELRAHAAGREQTAGVVALRTKLALKDAQVSAEIHQLAGRLCAPA
jgi:hypothetical protein